VIFLKLISLLVMYGYVTLFKHSCYEGQSKQPQFRIFSRRYEIKRIRKTVPPGKRRLDARNFTPR
jgi:hypothetical protein